MQLINHNKKILKLILVLEMTFFYPLNIDSYFGFQKQKKKVDSYFAGCTIKSDASDISDEH